ncbi:MAG: glycosyltransferase family 4 protein [Balneolaceae bacterium]
MNRSRTLITSYYWPPSGGPGVQRILKFVKYLPEYGVDPSVLTVANPTYPLRDPTLLEEVPPGIQVYKTRTLEPFALYAGLKGGKADDITPATEIQGDTLTSTVGSWVRANLLIPDARAGWVVTATRRALKLVEDQNIDTILTSGPPHSVHFIGKWVSQRTGIRWIADFRDPWSQVYYNQLLPRTQMAEQIDESLERRILQEASEVIVVSDRQAEHFRKHCERGYRVIPNGFDPADFPDPRPTPDPPKEGRYCMRHIGTVGEAAIPHSLLRLLAKTPELPVDLEFMGDLHNDLQKEVTALELGERVTLSGYRPHREAVDAMCRSQLLLLILPAVPEMEHHIPGKLFEYLGTGRPILMLGPPEGESARRIRNAGGQVVAPDDTDGLLAALQSLITQLSVHPDAPDISHPDLHPSSRTELSRQLAQLIHQTEAGTPPQELEDSA